MSLTECSALYKQIYIWSLTRPQHAVILELHKDKLTEKDALDKRLTLIVINTEHSANPFFFISTRNLKLETKSLILLQPFVAGSQNRPDLVQDQ